MYWKISAIIKQVCSNKDGSEVRDYDQTPERFVRFVDFRNLKKRETDRPTNGWTDPLIKMRGRI